QDHLAVFQRNQAVVQISSGHRYVLAEAEGVMLVDPRIVTGLCAVLADPLKPGTWVLIKTPAFGTVIAGSLGTIQRAFAFSPVEAGQVSARKRCPNHALLVDVGAADAETWQRYVVNFGEGRFRRI